MRRGRRRVEVIREGVRRERRRRAEGEVARGTDWAEVGAGPGGEAPWMVHAAWRRGFGIWVLEEGGDEARGGGLGFAKDREALCGGRGARRARKKTGKPLPARRRLVVFRSGPYKSCVSYESFREKDLIIIITFLAL